MAGGVEDNRLPAAVFLPQLLVHYGVTGEGGLEEGLGVCLLPGAEVGSSTPGSNKWTAHVC